MIRKNACQVEQRISKKTVLACFETGTKTRKWLESIPNDNWQIVSFMPEIRTVCLIVLSKHGVFVHVSLTLPNF